MGLGALVGSEGGPDRVSAALELYYQSLNGAHGPAVNAQNALMTAGFCHENPQIAASRGTELVSWYLEQQRERARLVWQGVDPASVPPDYQGYYQRDLRLAAGPHPDDPTPEQVVKRGANFCVGTPDDCIRFIENYEAMGIQQIFCLCAIGPATHQETMNTLQMFGQHIIPHFQAKQKT